jgi:hypothetical protein
MPSYVAICGDCPRFLPLGEYEWQNRRTALAEPDWNYRSLGSHREAVSTGGLAFEDRVNPKRRPRRGRRFADR